MNYPPSKLPDVGTTIFTVMSKMAADHNAINLSQGFPDFNGPKALLEKVGYYVEQGANQYAPMAGVPRLREAIAEKVQRHYGREVSAENEITVTSGGTEAIFDALAATVSVGEEVIILDPAFDCYAPAVLLNGGVPVHVQLQPPSFAIDWDVLQAAITPKTRMIMLNSPHNPTGAVFTSNDIEALCNIVRGTDILLLGDDVYEHILFDGKEHHSFIRTDELYQRSFSISSFGKTYHATGWKLAYCVAPPKLTEEFRKVHQFVTFTSSTPKQLALADYMEQDPQHCYDLAGFYQQKRDLFNTEMAKSRFTFTPSGGTYFQLMDYSAINSEMNDVEFCEWLTKEVGVAAIPISVFCKEPPEMKLVRFCFAKNDETLLQATRLLTEL
uniref:Aspartate aminotransferase (EC) n=1 Tax=uncultured Thiotrichaceae bacterium TaxID=298394 RepID=A0A6S6UIR6_9GAMM|nr:MAG: Aspartate aminotransferase (EC [uncultured Thiotrichaceae bacterium]